MADDFIVCINLAADDLISKELIIVKRHVKIHEILAIIVCELTKIDDHLMPDKDYSVHNIKGDVAEM